MRRRGRDGHAETELVEIGYCDVGIQVLGLVGDDQDVLAAAAQDSRDVSIGGGAACVRRSRMICSGVPMEDTVGR